LKLWKIPGPVIRIAVLFVAAIVILIVVRQLFVPESFGRLGHYRADAVDVVANQEIRYAGLQACAECHTDEAEIKAASYHRGLSCEGCHGPAKDHVDDPTEQVPIVPTGRETCLRCHDYQVSRPTGFPQVIEAVHNPMEPCAACHEPHDPTPPEVPGACSACHGAIDRIKAVSHHHSLDCETCHLAPPGHSEKPREFPPQKPTERSFCGECHAADAASAREIPRVDLSIHGGRFLCWQCHYPHFPEGR